MVDSICTHPCNNTAAILYSFTPPTHFKLSRMLLPSRRLCVIAPSLARLVLMRTNLVEAIVGEENGRFLIGDGRPFEISHCGGIISVGIFWVLNYVTRDLGERRPALFILLDRKSVV